MVPGRHERVNFASVEPDDALSHHFQERTQRACVEGRVGDLAGSPCMEHVMRNSISYAALAVALAAGTTAAHAQTVIPSQPVETVITQPPAQSVTTETVQTVRPASRRARREVVTTRRTVTTTTPAPVATIAANPAPLYDRAPLYDTVAPPATLDETVLDAQPAVTPAVPVATTTAPGYRYVYESDRILVVDPATGIAVQSLPR
jgi:hypothetical protein